MRVLPAPPKQEPKQKSRPIALWLPEEYKSADINAKQGLITAYLTVYKNPDGTDFVDPYLDVIQPGCFNKTIKDLEAGRRARNTPYLCCDLWQHDRKEVIGGIKGLTEDSRGVIYEAELVLGVQRAREAFELAAKRVIGSSFGYDPIRFEHKGDIRHLTEVRLHEVSQVTFPANDIAPILETKDNGTKFYVPEMPKKSSDDTTSSQNFLDFPQIPGMDGYIGTEDAFNLKAVVGFTGMAIGPRDEVWDYRKAKAQYKSWGLDKDGFAIPDKYKQVHLLVDGNPKDATAYDYPYCYITDGVPHICVDAVRQIIKSLKTVKTIEAPLMREKCVKILERINTKYMHAPPITDNQPMQFDWKQDFTTAWTRKLPSQMMQEFFRMSDTLTYVLLNNFDDDDISDKASSVDTCANQYATAVKEWLPEYLAAEEAQDALEDDNTSEVMPMYGMYGLDMSNVSMKRTLEIMTENVNVKEGRALSERTK